MEVDEHVKYRAPKGDFQKILPGIIVVMLAVVLVVTVVEVLVVLKYPS